MRSCHVVSHSALQYLRTLRYSVIQRCKQSIARYASRESFVVEREHSRKSGLSLKKHGIPLLYTDAVDRVTETVCAALARCLLVAAASLSGLECTPGQFTEQCKAALRKSMSAAFEVLRIACSITDAGSLILYPSLLVDI